MILDSEDVWGLTGLSFDSRTTRAGEAFFCLPGESYDGHDHAQEAVSRGAAMVIASRDLPELGVPVIRVPHVREALGRVAHEFYGYPSDVLAVTGVTGTNGKTTITHILAQILPRTGIIGTLGTLYGGQTRHGSGRTTPEAPELHENLAWLRDRGARGVAMEVSSHALEQGRVAGCRFREAVLSNLTQDHLDYHLTMDNYFAAKAKLFEGLTEGSMAILNADDSWYERFRGKVPRPANLCNYGLGGDARADVRGEDVRYGHAETLCRLVTPDGQGDLRLPLPGTFNLYNALAAASVAWTRGMSVAEIAARLEHVRGAPGRFQVLPKPDASLPTCIVDYAHSPDGLSNLLQGARRMLTAPGRLYCVFGCGGDRDTTKRPQMGKISSELADVSIVTSDNPRSEDPEQIVADILAGFASLTGVQVISDRREAIRWAISQASSQDLVVVAGKGHEDYQILADRTVHFDDSEEVAAAYGVRA